MASTAEKSLLQPADIPDRRPRFRSERTRGFTESVIREMTRLAAQHNAVNLAQGFPDFPAPEILKHAARDAIAADINQYAITWGAKPFRDAIAAKYRRTYGLELDPEREITVCCGVDRRHDRVADGRHQSRRRSGHLRAVLRKLRPRYAAVRRRAQVRQAASRRTGRFDPRRAAPGFFAAHQGHHSVHAQQSDRAACSIATSSNTSPSLCQEFDALAITDEIYEHILYDGAEHIPIMTHPRHARPHHPGQQHEQDLRGHRMARGLGAGEPRI